VFFPPPKPKIFGGEKSLGQNWGLKKKFFGNEVTQKGFEILEEKG